MERLRQTQGGVLTLREAEELGVLDSAEGVVRESPNQPWRLVNAADVPNGVSPDSLQKRDTSMPETKSHVSLHRALAHLNKGGLHRALGVPEGETIPADKLESAKNSDNPHIRKMAQFAGTMENFHHSK